MIDAWTWPAYVAVLFGAVTFVVFFAPIVVIESRTYGRLSPVRLAGAALFAVYGMALVAYTLLPWPEPDWCDVHESPSAQWRPFHSLDDILTDTAGLSLLARLESAAVLQVVFNVVLFVPWGLFVRRFFGRGAGLTVLSGAAVSVLVEITQGTGVFGLAGCAYRVADIDDVLANTAGAVIGTLLAPVLLRWMPGRELRRTRRLPRPVTRTRRLLGMVVDLAAYAAVAAVVATAYRAYVYYGRGDELPAADGWGSHAVPSMVAFVLVVLVPALYGPGASLGQRALWLVPRWPDGAALRRRALVRALCGLGLYGVLDVVSALPRLAGDTASAAESLTNLVIVVSGLAVLFGGPRGLSFRLTGADVADARERPDGDRLELRSPDDAERS
ncbi:VanZ family protein [Jiangella rhizosphaerae]|uniref:VanZ family protein n=1 Tax=Jiangella rhizosphaerae TaxID=2293569 RepID=A0A418KHW2_9ACTN|nr:VanZ family protein [Jiangella rhizosphaerae]RIQ12209.1 VanZ family protein [Jiangella rhizosphaerae]